MSSVEVKLKRADRVYHPGEPVTGCIVINSKDKFAHNGISMAVEGVVTLQLSARSVGIFEAFYNQIQPVQLMKTSLDIQSSGKLPPGVTELPFEFPLEPLAGQKVREGKKDGGPRAACASRLTPPRLRAPPPTAL